MPSTNRSTQLMYKKRAFTAPHLLCSSSCSNTLPTRFPVKTIKSLNFYCLSQIFEYVEYKDLINFRLVCTFWKECIDFHLARRTHFVYGKSYNSLGRNGEPETPEAVPDQPKPQIFNYPCQKCFALNSKNNDSPSSSGLSSSEDLSASSSLSASRTSLSSNSDSIVSSEILVENEEEGEESIRCPDCQQAIMMKLAPETTSERCQDFYNQFIDYINLATYERILSTMPNLTTLKLAGGYRYAGVHQSCLDVTNAAVVQRTYRHCPRLTNIDLSNCIGLTELDFQQLAKFFGSKLVSLNVSGCRIDENCLRIIVKNCDRLRYLNISNNFCRLQGGCLEWISDRIETVVADFNQNVRVLDGLIQGKGKNIIELELNVGYCFNPSMPYKILGSHFANLISLKIIFKSFGQHKSGTFVHLSQLKELECLYLIEEIDDFDSESSLDDYSVLKILQSCGLKLRELYLHAASSIFGGSSALTDTAIGQIDQLCPLLEVFSIKRASITNASLDAISRLKNAYTVQLIDLEYISEEGIKQIMTKFREAEDQHKEKIKKVCGIDLDVGKNGPKMETKLRR